MNWNDALQTILNDVLREASEDLVGLWLVHAWVRRAFPNLDPSAARDATLSIVARAVAGGEVLVGSFAEGEFEIWPVQSDAMRRIAKQWVDPRRDSTIEDNVWLSGRDLGYRTKASAT